MKSEDMFSLKIYVEDVKKILRDSYTEDKFCKSKFDYEKFGKICSKVLNGRAYLSYSFACSISSLLPKDEKIEKAFNSSMFVHKIINSTDRDKLDMLLGLHRNMALSKSDENLILAQFNKND